MATLVPEPKTEAHDLTNKWGRLSATVLGHPCCTVITAVGHLQLTQVWPPQDPTD